MTPSPYRPRRVIVAVSGTIQDGFELRRNIDYRPPALSGDGEDDDGDDDVVEAVFLGWALARGAKMYFDVKDEATSREYDPRFPHRVNPAVVLTGDANDANRYALYAADERACLEALLGEPRLLAMTPDSVRIDLDDSLTGPEVAALARAMMGAASGDDSVVYRSDECAVLAVVACYRPNTFVPAPPYLTREDGTRITSFRESLALFAGLDGETAAGGDIIPGSDDWNEAVASALEEARVRIASGVRREEDGGKTPGDDGLYGTSKSCFRLSRRISAAEFNGIAESAGLTLRI